MQTYKKNEFQQSIIKIIPSNYLAHINENNYFCQNG